MSVGPRRRTNPIEEWGVKLGVLAGRSSGGGVGAEQRRIPATHPAASIADGGPPDLWSHHHNSPLTTGDVWQSNAITVPFTTPRMGVVKLHALIATPDIVGRASVTPDGPYGGFVATAPVDHQGWWGVVVPRVLIGTFSFEIRWPTALTGNFQVFINVPA